MAWGFQQKFRSHHQKREDKEPTRIAGLGRAGAPLHLETGREKGKEAGGKGSPGACRGFSSPEILGTSRLPLVVTLPSQLLLQCLQTLLSKQA